jgi:hypothetical protein
MATDKKVPPSRIVEITGRASAMGTARGVGSSIASAVGRTTTGHGTPLPLRVGLVDEEIVDEDPLIAKRTIAAEGGELRINGHLPT